MPLYDNRSLAFAPAFENSEFEAVNVLTAGLPAEYGRRLGGVIALDTRRSASLGHRFALDLQDGSYGTRMGSVAHQFARRGTALAVGVLGGSTDRYLDPPSLENFTNRASSSGGNARVAHDLAESHRLTFYARSNRTGFLVPNDLAQQEGGAAPGPQSGGNRPVNCTTRARSRPAPWGRLRGMVRDLTSELWSNALATPVHAQQDRGFREAAVLRRHYGQLRTAHPQVRGRHAPQHDPGDLSAGGAGRAPGFRPALPGTGGAARRPASICRTGSSSATSPATWACASTTTACCSPTTPGAPASRSATTSPRRACRPTLRTTASFSRRRSRTFC